MPSGEAGLLLTKVLKSQPFLGYRGPREQSKRKLVADVRRVGDLYYNTGDVLSLDSEGFFYFRDRLGDTFRWAGGWGFWGIQPPSGWVGPSLPRCRASLSGTCPLFLGCGFSSQGQNIPSWAWGLLGEGSIPFRGVDPFLSWVITSNRAGGRAKMYPRERWREFCQA